MSDHQRKLLDAVVTVLLSALAIWAIWSFLRGQIVFDLIVSDSQRFQTYIANQSGYWPGVIFSVIVVLEVVIAFIPGWFLYPAGGAIFGFQKTILLILIGNIIGASICFWIGRKWGSVILEKFVAPKHVAKFNAYMEEKGSWSVFLLKVNPLTSLDIWNYVAGASKMKFWKFSIANLLGIIPMTVFSAALGTEGFNASPQILTVFMVLTVVYIVWFFVSLPRKFRKAKQQE